MHQRVEDTLVDIKRVEKFLLVGCIGLQFLRIHLTLLKTA